MLEAKTPRTDIGRGTMSYSNWFPLDRGQFQPSVDVQSRLPAMLVSLNNAKITIEVRTDSEELIGYCHQYLAPAPAGMVPDCSLSFLLNTPTKMLTPRGQDYLLRSPSAQYNDAAIDVPLRHILYAGSRHYGLLKSIVAGLHSFHHASSHQQGLHAAAVCIGESGVLIAGGAGSGKTGLFLRLLNYATAVATDDWCDVSISGEGALSAIGVERNISFNIRDVVPLVEKGLIPSKFAKLAPIPHGHREKVVGRLGWVCPGKVTDSIGIRSIYILEEVDKPVCIRKISPAWLHQRLAAISTHMPFCYPADGLAPIDRWGQLPSASEMAVSIRAAISAVDHYLGFCTRLAGIINEGKCALVLLPSSQKVSYEDKVSAILKREALK